jgi:hypothetical protein
MPNRLDPTIEFNSISYRGQYTFVNLTLHWDEGEATLGAGTIALELPVPREAVRDSGRICELATELVRKVIDTTTLRAWRGGP